MPVVLNGTRCLPYAQKSQVSAAMDLFAALVWVFRDQLRGWWGRVEEELLPWERPGRSGCGCAVLEKIGRVGTAIDVSRGPHSERVHSDARALADAVFDLGISQTLIPPAREGEPPTIVKGAPKAHWFTPDRSRCERYSQWKDDDTGQQHDIELSINRREGRDGVFKITYTKRVFIGKPHKSRLVTGSREWLVTYCPVRWDPDPSDIIRSVRQYAEWRSDMQVLLENLPELTNRSITGIRQPLIDPEKKLQDMGLLVDTDRCLTDPPNSDSCA